MDSSKFEWSVPWTAVMEAKEMRTRRAIGAMFLNAIIVVL